MTTTQLQPDATNSRRAKPERLLVADDEHLVAIGIRNHLIELGYAVIGPAVDGDEAIEMARIERPDMALLDIRMPNADGIAAGKIISGQLGIPVIIVSAYADEEYVTAAAGFGTFGYLLKPASQDDLRVTVETAWSRFLDQQEERSNVARLKQRLEDRKVIEQAKWLLVSRKNIPEPDAMRLLQKQARNNRRTLVDVARSLIENESLLNEE